MAKNNTDEIIVKFDEVTKQYGDLVVLDKLNLEIKKNEMVSIICLLYTSPSPRDVEESRMPSSA